MSPGCLFCNEIVATNSPAFLIREGISTRDNDFGIIGAANQNVAHADCLRLAVDAFQGGVPLLVRRPYGLVYS